MGVSALLKDERGIRDRFAGEGTILIGVPPSAASNDAREDSLPNERKSKFDNAIFT